jgi:hypothetical protein
MNVPTNLRKQVHALYFSKNTTRHYQKKQPTSQGESMKFDDVHNIQKTTEGPKIARIIFVKITKW